MALLCLLTGRLGYIKRTWVLFNVMRRKPSSANFRLEGNRLMRNSGIFGLTGSVDMLLDDQDVALLRRVYLTTRESDLKQWLTKSLSNTEAERLLRKHEQLGTLIRLGEKLISVVNDPGYWAEKNALATDEAKADSALAVKFA